MRNVVITGGTKGIGLALVKKYLNEHQRVITCSRSIDDLKELKSQFSDEKQLNLFIFQCDLSRKEQCIALAAYVKDIFKNRTDILINNTGIFFPGETLEENDEQLEVMMKTNLYSAYYLNRELIPGMVAIGSGHVVNMCSIASITPLRNGGSYSISKYALYGYTKVLREELKDKGVKVTAILPGATWSNSWRGVDLPRERLMEAEDISESIWAVTNLGQSAVVEDLIIRPQLGDL